MLRPDRVRIFYSPIVIVDTMTNKNPYKNNPIKQKTYGSNPHVSLGQYAGKGARCHEGQAELSLVQKAWTERLTPLVWESATADSNELHAANDAAIANQTTQSHLKLQHELLD